MMTSIVTSKAKGGYSAIVEMALIIDGASHRIGQLGPDFLILETPFIHAPTSAEILTEIDGNQDRWTVYLPKGVSKTERRVVIKAA